MRLLVVSSWFPAPPINGSKLRAFHLLAQLRARGHHVSLLSFAEAGEETHVDQLRSLCDSIELVRGNPHKPTVSLPALGLFNRMPRSYATTYCPEMAGLIAARSHGHDALLMLQIGAALYLRKDLGIPVVFDEAEVGVILERYRRERHPLQQARHGLTWWKYAGFIRSLTRLATRTTTVSQVERQHLIDAGCDGDRIDEVPNGVAGEHLDSAAPRATGDAPLIYSGSITYQANLDAVTYLTNDILPRLRMTHPRANIQVTGDTGAVDTRPFTAAGDVTFTGRVPDVTAIVRAARLCLVPLRVGGGTRLKILEAMAIGTPVVSTSKGIEGLDVTPGEDVIIGDDAESFARQVARVLDDDELYARLSARGRETVARRYTWRHAGDALEHTMSRAVADFRGNSTVTMRAPRKGNRGAA